MKILDLSTDTVTQLVRSSARLAEVLDSKQSGVNFFIFSVALLLLCRMIGKFNHSWGLHNLMMLIQKIQKKLKIKIMTYIYIYMCIMIRDHVTFEGFRILDYLETKHRYKA